MGLGAWSMGLFFRSPVSHLPSPVSVLQAPCPMLQASYNTSTLSYTLRIAAAIKSISAFVPINTLWCMQAEPSK